MLKKCVIIIVFLLILPYTAANLESCETEVSKLADASERKLNHVSYVNNIELYNSVCKGEYCAFRKLAQIHYNKSDMNTLKIKKLRCKLKYGYVSLIVSGVATVYSTYSLFKNIKDGSERYDKYLAEDNSNDFEGHRELLEDFSDKILVFEILCVSSFSLFIGSIFYRINIKKELKNIHEEGRLSIAFGYSKSRMFVMEYRF